MPCIFSKPDDPSTEVSVETVKTTEAPDTTLGDTGTEAPETTETNPARNAFLWFHFGTSDILFTNFQC